MNSPLPGVALLFALLSMLATTVCGQTFAAKIELTGIDGKTLDPLDAEGKRGVVLFFVSPYCPTSNRFGPEMNAILEDFDESFAFRFVHSDTSVTEADMIQHATQMGFAAPVLRDEHQELAKHAGAKITPEVVVLDPNAATLYQGRINDLYLSPTKRQREVTSHDLREALAAIREDRAVAIPRTEAMGCEIGVK